MGKAKKQGLTANQKRFVEEYVVDRNGVQAYFRAFGRRKANKQKRSYNAAQVASKRLLGNDTIRAEIKAAQRELSKATNITAKRVLDEYACVAFATPDDLYEPASEANGGLPQPRSWADISPRAKRAVASIKIKRKRLTAGGDDSTEWEIEELDYKMHSKDSALNSLAKHLGLTKDGAALEQLLEAFNQHRQGNQTAVPKAGGESGADASVPEGD